VVFPGHFNALALATLLRRWRGFGGVCDSADGAILWELDQGAMPDVALRDAKLSLLRTSGFGRHSIGLPSSFMERGACGQAVDGLIYPRCLEPVSRGRECHGRSRDLYKV